MSIKLRIVDAEHVTHEFFYPWQFNLIADVLKNGARRTYVKGLVENGIEIPMNISTLTENLYGLTDVIKWLRVCKVVYAPSFLEGIKLLFDNDLNLALTELVTGNDIEVLNLQKSNRLNWNNAIDIALLHRERIKSLGYGFYADTQRK